MKGIYVRHDTRHTNERVHTAKADTDAPKSCCTNDTLAEYFVSCCEAKNGTWTVCDTFVYITPRMVGETRVVNSKPKMVEHLGDFHSG